ncbi:hypothetical protein [Halorubrum tailed virus BLv36]|nr:hypothetical protein [Halorubrum tailed virus BLv36]
MAGKKRVKISREFIAHAIRNVDDGRELPPDAELVGFEYSAEKDIYNCVFVSDEFSNVLEGAYVEEVENA